MPEPLKVTATKRVGDITNRYWALIHLDEHSDVTQIQINKLTGSRENSKVETFTLDGEDGAAFIEELAGELD